MINVFMDRYALLMSCCVIFSSYNFCGCLFVCLWVETYQSSSHVVFQITLPSSAALLRVMKAIDLFLWTNTLSRFHPILYPCLRTNFCCLSLKQDDTTDKTQIWQCNLLYILCPVMLFKLALCWLKRDKGVKVLAFNSEKVTNNWCFFFQNSFLIRVW